MTLGDRVAVMRGGLIQQVDTPAVLYEDPVNLFVAGFIGSPAMNFLPGRLDGEVIHIPVGDVKIPDELRSKLQAAPGGHEAGREVIVGIRPEHFEDASLMEPGHVGTRFRARVDVVESMGSELYAYFEVKGADIQTRELAELAADSGMEDLPRHGGDTQQVVARLDAASGARAGQEVELSLDAAKLKLFDPETGRSLTAPAAEAVAAA
jgi:multiple sugar transport system ATP-binding protein